jgi:hypothetical protein
VGGYPIVASAAQGVGLSNYTIFYTNGTLTVVAAPLLVTADNTNRAYGQPNPAFTATITGWANGEDTNVLGGALVLTSPAQTNSPVGTYPIIPEGLTSTNYSITFSNGTLTVTAPTPPSILSAVRSAGTNIVITWSSISNSVYRVQHKADVTHTNWIDLTPDVTATGSTASFTDQPGGEGQRFYRVALVP